MGKRINDCYCCAGQPEDVECCFYSERSDPTSLLVTIPPLGWGQFEDLTQDGYEVDEIYHHFSPLLRNGMTVECTLGELNCGALFPCGERLCPLYVPGPVFPPSRVIGRAYYSDYFYELSHIERAVEISNDPSITTWGVWAYGRIIVTINNVKYTDSSPNRVVNRCGWEVHYDSQQKRADRYYNDVVTVENELNWLESEIEFGTTHFRCCKGFNGFFEPLGRWSYSNIRQAGFNGGTTLAQGGIPYIANTPAIFDLSYDMQMSIADSNRINGPRGWAFVQRAYCDGNVSVVAI